MNPLLTKRFLLCCLTTLALADASPPAAAQNAAQPTAQNPAPSTAQKVVVTKASQLPSRTYTLAKRPSELLVGPLADVLGLADQLEQDVQADLDKFDIQDAATLRDKLGQLVVVALLRGRWSEVPALTARVRVLQDKPGTKATSGVVSDAMANFKAQSRDDAWLSADVAQRFGAMNWLEAQDSIKETKGKFELVSGALIIGSFKISMDVIAKNAENGVPQDVVNAIVSARVMRDLLLPHKAAIVAGLDQVVKANTQTAAKPDLWSPRLVALPAGLDAKSVIVAVWDSGVDLALFRTGAEKGIAFDSANKPTDTLLRPLGESQARLPQLKTMVSGFMDMSAALDTEAARKVKLTMAELKADEVKVFREDLSNIGSYMHGTHVAGIATAGNPYASVYAVSMLWDHRTEPTLPSIESAKLVAANYRLIADKLKGAGVRVVNMSWRYSPKNYESALAWHNVGKTSEERKALALQIFTIESDALREAIASAPNILFVAGSGNEDNSADFESYIPAGLQLPNLITVGAVDASGGETSFSSFGKTVQVHANGFQVESLVPGGDKMKLSGTSMAAPQVTNLAAKLWAVKPELTVEQVKQFIVEGAEHNGRVNWINPKKSLRLAAMAKAG
jgi:subtilisin family serine protease